MDANEREWLPGKSDGSGASLMGLQIRDGWLEPRMDTDKTACVGLIIAGFRMYPFYTEVVVAFRLYPCPPMVLQPCLRL